VTFREFAKSGISVADPVFYPGGLQLFFLSSLSAGYRGFVTDVFLNGTLFRKPFICLLQLFLLTISKNIKMKKAIAFFFFSLAFMAGLPAQTKTDLSLKVSAAAAANRQQLASYTWTRTVQVFIEGELKNTMVSALSVGPDGKMVTTAVSSKATDPPPTKGIRGKVAKNKIADMKTYVEDAVKVSMSYVYMTKGGMVNYFDAAGITESGNTITVNGTNVNKPGDQMTMNITSGTLAIISESFKSTSGEDAIAGTFNYKTYSNGLTAFDNGELDLPAKDMKLRIVNTNYAKKLQ
jgi:hypothetical protein